MKDEICIREVEWRRIQDFKKEEDLGIGKRP
jgi:hypothetical protein